MAYRVIVPRKVQKEINKISPPHRVKIEKALKVIAQDPFLGKRLEGKRRGEWSFRAWPYRIIYRIKKDLLIVLVIHIGHRQGVYR